MKAVWLWYRSLLPTKSAAVARRVDPHPRADGRVRECCSADEVGRAGGPPPASD